MGSRPSSGAGGVSHRDDIDGLRAVSVTAVVLHHLGATWLPGGFVGVDVFFVISGYLITGIIARESDEGRFSFLDFYERRIRRIYPALLAMLAVTAFFAWYIFLQRDLRSFGFSLVWTPLFGSNFVFMGQTGYFDPDASTKPLLHTWSLGVEEQYYLLFPFVLLGAKRFGLDRMRVVAGLVIASFAASVLAGVLHYSNAYYLLPMRIWEIGAGALLALAPPRRLGERARSALGVGGLALVLVSLVVIDESVAFPGWVAALPVVGATAVLASGTGPAARLLATAPFAFVGRISYPAYLWHWPPIVFCQMYFYHPATLGEAIGIVVFTVVVSWASMAVLETPVRTRRILATRRRLFVVMGGLSLAMVVLGALFFNKLIGHGAMPPEQAAVTAVLQEGNRIGEICPGYDTAEPNDRDSCVVGRRDDPSLPISFVILGDSHARAVAGAIDAAAEAVGRKGLYFGRAGCPPIPGIAYFDEDVTLGCDANLAMALSKVERLAGVTDVLVVSRWTRSAWGREYGRDQSRLLGIFSGGQRVAEAERASLLLARLGGMLDGLSGRRVTLVAGIPEIRFDVPAGMANALRLGRPPPQGPSRHEHEEWQRAARRLLDGVAAGRPWVRVADPTALLCGSGVCAVSDGQRPYYFDADHLSRAGAALLIPLFEAALRPAAR